MSEPRDLDLPTFQARPVAPAGPLGTLAEMEREHIRRALHELGWVKKNVADALGISRPTLDRKIRLYGLEPER